MKLEAYERETVITFDETSAPSIVFTFNKAWQKRFKELGIKPHYTTDEGAMEFHIDKHRIKPPRAPRKLTKEQRKAAGDRLRNRLIGGKSPLIKGKSKG